MRRLYWACLGLAVLTALATAVTSAVPRALAEELEITATAVVTSTDDGTAVNVTTEGAEGEHSVDVVVEEEDGELVLEAIVDDAEEEDADDDAEEEQTYTLTLVKSPYPEYPEDARRDGAEGRVMLRLSIADDGTVADVVPVEEVEGYPSLTEAAVEAVSEWIFEISGDTDDDKIEVQVPIEFKLDGHKSLELKATIEDDDSEGADAEDDD